MGCAVFGHPFGVHAASCSTVNDQLAFEIIGRAERTFSNVFDPVRFKSIVVKVIPLVAERNDRIASFCTWEKPRYSDYNRLTPPTSPDDTAALNPLLQYDNFSRPPARG